MCFLVDDDDSVDGSGSGSNSGSPKLQLKKHHTWLIPRKILMVILAIAIIFLILGLIFLAIGGGIGSTGLKAIGGILFGLAIIALIVCLIVCMYAYFYYGTRDQAVQTTDIQWTEEYMAETPGYASIGRPSALKSADSTLRRNGTVGQKKVTMAPELGPYGESPPHNVQGGHIIVPNRPQAERSPSYGSNNVFFNDGQTVNAGADPRGPGGRTVASSEVGTGGIRITSLDRNQPFPSPGSQIMYGGGAGQVHSGVEGSHVMYGGGAGHVVYSGGGSSASSSMDTYAYPKNPSVVSGPESGFSESTLGSQYSTIRSIPVTHIMSDSPRQHQQKMDSVEYARVNKQAKTAHTMNVDMPAQRGFVVQSQGHLSSPGQFPQQRIVVEEDFDYDNPVERAPMLPPKQHKNLSYHEQQMQYQRQQRHLQQDMHAPRQLNSQSLQRQQASNPYYQQQQQHHHHQQQQQSRYQSSYATSRNMRQDDLPEPQPLVYPSARRPMTFEQVSSSKMSVYDNVLAGLKDVEEE